MANITYTVSAEFLQQDQDVFAIEIDRRVATIFTTPQVGRAILRLDNKDGNYAPSRNANMLINEAVDITVQDSLGTTHSLFSGVVDRFSQNPAPGEETAIVECSDIARLLRRTVNIPLKIDIQITSLVAIVLSETGISTTSIDEITDEAPFSLVDDTSAGGMIEQIIRAGEHYAYVSGDGTFRFRDRNFDVGATVVNSYEKFLSYDYETTEERLMNDVRVRGAPREATTNVQTIAWLPLQPNVTIPASESISFFLEFIDPSNRESRTPANSVATPVNSTDYTLNTQADGNGVDLTSTASVSATIFSRTAKITYFNGSGDEGTITKMKIRGFPLRRTPSFAEQKEVTSSQNQYGRHSFTVNNDLIPDANFAQNYAENLASRWSSPLEQLRIGIKNQEPDIFEHELLDLIHIVNSITGIKDDYHIMSVNHRISFSESGREHIAEYGVRLFQSKLFLILDKDPEGKLDVRKLGF